MANKINLTERNRDYAVFLPSISSFYDRTISKYREQGDAFFPPERIPAGFEDGLDGCDFLKPDAYYNYKWSLYSAGHAQLDTNKALVHDNMVQGRDRNTSFVLGDSGGFQIIKGVIQCDWKNFKTDDSLRHTILNWLEHTADYSMILDIPTLAAEPTFRERTGISNFNECLDYTDFNVRWFIKNRKHQTKYLNVMQGRNWNEAEYWYEQMKQHDLDGFAFGGSTKNDINIVLRTLIKMRDDKQLEQGKRDLLHYLGISRLEWSVAYTAIKRALREHVNPNMEVTFDCASPFIATAKGQMYTQHVHRNDRFGYVMDSAVDSKKLSQTNLPFPWSSPIADRLTMGDICWYAPGMVNKIGKEGKTSWDSLSYFLLMAHNVYQHIESVQRANALTDSATKLYQPDYRQWRKVKNGSKEDQFDAWVPRNVLYLVNFIDELFKSETPYTMLDDAEQMLANFNGSKSIKSSNASFNNLFEVEEPENDFDGEFTDDQAEEAEAFLEALN